MLNSQHIYTQGEISALVNLSRLLGGFSVSYFQVPWATKNGALQTFGVEAAVVISLFLLVIPFMQLKGSYLRVSDDAEIRRVIRATTCF